MNIRRLVPLPGPSLWEQHLIVFLWDKHPTGTQDEAQTSLVRHGYGEGPEAHSIGKGLAL